MASSKAQAPPANLKERIAALQQQNASPTAQRPTSPVDLVPPKTGLRDKIAKFEKKGGVPVPRGSFGLGAPPPLQKGQEKRRNELYGNRIPGARVTSGPPVSRLSGPLDSARSFSTSAMELKDVDHELSDAPTSPFLGLSADHVQGKEPTQRGTTFTVALDKAKQLESALKTEPTSSEDAVSSADSQETSAREPDQPPIAVVMSTDDNVSAQASPGTTTPSTPLVEVAVVKGLRGTDSSQTIMPEPPNLPQAAQDDPEDSVTTRIVPQPQSRPAEVTVVTPAKADDAVSILARPNALTIEITSQELSPADEFTVEDLGKVVTRMQDMLPDQTSPVISLSSHEPLPTPISLPKSISSPSSAQQDDSRSMNGSVPGSPQDTKSTVSIRPPIEEDPAKTPIQELSKQPVSLLSKQPSSRSHFTRPTTMFETGSTPAPLVAPRPVSSSQPNEGDQEHSPMLEEKGAGVESAMRLGTNSTSADAKSTFSAVVYKKSADAPPSQLSNPTSGLYSTLPRLPPKPVDTTGPALPDMLFSPGFTELSSLLQNAALLERSLETGDLPGEATKEEEQRKTDEEQRARIIEDTKEAVSVKRDTSEGKSKSRNPMLRSKTWRKDESGEVQVNPVRTKSFFFSFRHSQDNQPAPAPTEQRTSGEDMDASSQKSASTSAKSPRGYFSSLRRLTVGPSRSSTPTGAHSRHSVSTSSEMSSEDSGSLPTPPGGHASEPSEASINDFGCGPGVSWPASQPKRTASTTGRASSFKEMMTWGRSRTRSTMSTTSVTSAPSAYNNAIDRLAKSSASKSAVTLLPPLESLSYEVDVPGVPSQHRHMIPAARSASVYVPSSNSQHPPFNPQQPFSLDSVFASKLTGPSPDLTPQPTFTSPRLDLPHPLDDARLASKPTSRQAASTPSLRLDEDGTRPSVMLHDTASFLSAAEQGTRDSWVSADSSMDASIISFIPGRLVDSFPSVPPRELPLSIGNDVTGSRRPMLPPVPASGSLFESTPSLPSEFLPASITVRRSLSVSAARTSGGDR